MRAALSPPTGTLMNKTILPLCAAAMLTACGSLRMLDNDPGACDRMTDWSQRQTCKEKAGARERDWERQQKEKQSKG